MGEQVSHHPPVTAFHADGTSGYAFHGSIQPKLKFWGKTVEIIPKGSITLDLYKSVVTLSISRYDNCYDIMYKYLPTNMK